MQRAGWLRVCAAAMGCCIACSPSGDESAASGPAVVNGGGGATGGALGGAGAAGASQAGAGASLDDPTLTHRGPDAGDAVSAPGDRVEPSTPDAGALDVDAGRDAATPPGDDDPELGRLSALSARLAPLAERTVSFWLSHGPDTVSGGFYGTLDRQGNPIAPEEKGLIQQSRQLWMLSTWYERRLAAPAVRELAEQQYTFLRRSFLDAADGAFVYRVSRDGLRVVDGKKQLFAESYAIYALATYGRVFGDAEATALALARFESIDATRHDAVNGGYDQRNDPGTLTAGAAKDSNTHLHLLEAFTPLYEATGDDRVAARLNELLDLFATRLRQPGNYVHAEFGLDWAPVGSPKVSYGLDLETAWLLLEAARVVGRASDPTLVAAALAIAANSAESGLDAQRGGYFESGVPGGAATGLDKIWWVQFEALEGLWWAHALSGEALQLDRLERTLDWVEFTEDKPVGEWFAITNPDGSAAGADYKGDEWKESYHPVRALVYLQDWIDAERAARRGGAH
jgi:cellobiose epimerase